ncbi:MAG: zf-HC2 domain-containing protein, partial [Planctomycetota bacterium]
MIATQECQEISVRLSAYIDRTLSNEECTVIEQHVRDCVQCRESIRRLASVQRLLNGTYNLGIMSPALKHKTGQRLAVVLAEKSASTQESELLLSEKSESFSDRLQVLGGAPWWGVSIALHVLVILLAGLISMSLALPTAEDAIVVITELQPPAQIKPMELEKPKNDNRAVLESKHDTPPTDPTCSDPSDIVVPPEIMALAELGDHFETINPDRPDTQSAFGNPDSHFFYSIKGNDEPEGGGGMGGCSLDNLIGVGGAASPGSGGGWGGGHGTGIGVGTGAGKG